MKSKFPFPGDETIGKPLLSRDDNTPILTELVASSTCYLISSRLLIPEVSGTSLAGRRHQSMRGCIFWNQREFPTNHLVRSRLPSSPELSVSWAWRHTQPLCIKPDIKCTKKIFSVSMLSRLIQVKENVKKYLNLNVEDWNDSLKIETCSAGIRPDILLQLQW